MEEMLEKIKTLSREELEQVMKAVEGWFAEQHPDWDVVYIAMPKEPEQRKQRLVGILRLVQKDLEWSERQYGKLMDEEKGTV